MATHQASRQPRLHQRRLYRDHYGRVGFAPGGTSCDCGWNFRALASLQGRKNDSLLIPSGREISSGFPLDAPYEILLKYRSGVKGFCLIQETENRIVFEIVPGAGWNSTIRKSIGDRFATFFEIGEVAECTKSKSGKRNPIISCVRRGAVGAIT